MSRVSIASPAFFQESCRGKVFFGLACRRDCSHGRGADAYASQPGLTSRHCSRRAAFGLCSCRTHRRGCVAAPPNIVMIISDDHAWTDYSFVGHQQIQTPHLDRLARREPDVHARLRAIEPVLPEPGVDHHRPVPASTQDDEQRSAASARKSHGGDFDNAADFRAGREIMTRHLEAVPTLPRLLARSGYVSLQTGKWWQGDFSRGGFTHGMTKGDRHGDEGSTSAARRCSRSTISSLPRAATSKAVLRLVRPDDAAPTAQPAGAIARRSTKKTPHRCTSPEYWAMVEWFDETSATCSSTSTSRDCAENTIVVYVTDNGWITDPDDRQLRAQVEAIAVRRRVAHADHDPLARACETAPFRCTGQLDRSGTHAAGGRRRGAAAAGCTASTCSTNRPSQARQPFSANASRTTRETSTTRPPACAGDG